MKLISFLNAYTSPNSGERGKGDLEVASSTARNSTAHSHHFLDAVLAVDQEAKLDAGKTRRVISQRGVGRNAADARISGAAAEQVEHDPLLGTSRVPRRSSRSQRPDVLREAPERLRVETLSLPTREGTLYVALAVDLRSGQPAGCSFGARYSTTLVIEALKPALTKRKDGVPVVIETDMGERLEWRKWSPFLQKHNVSVAVVGRYQPTRGQALIESLFRKVSIACHGTVPQLTRGEARGYIVRCIEQLSQGAQIACTTVASKQFDPALKRQVFGGLPRRFDQWSSE